MMAVPSMTPVLPELLGERETEPKTSRSVRSAPGRCVLTQKARLCLVAPIELVAGEPVASARGLDDAETVAGAIGGAGRYVQRGKVIGYWGSVPEAQP